MRSLTLFKDKAGFTLIEVVIVLGLVVLIAGTGLFIDFDNLRGRLFHSDKETLIAALQHARSQAVASICRGEDCEDFLSGRPHGVKIFNDRFVLFQGDSYDDRDPGVDAEIEANGNIDKDCAAIDCEVVFAVLSGDVANPGEIVLTDTTSSRSSTITVGVEGQIFWDDERI